MKTLESDMENIKKLLNDLGYAKDAISDIQTRIYMESFVTDEEILNEILHAKDFLIDAEKRIREIDEK